MLAVIVSAILQTRAWGEPELYCQLKDKRITESSGIAPSRRQDGVFYTHNDSGDTARFFRFDRSGSVTEYDVQGAQALDWEDMASASMGGKDWIYLGDIGDNGERRKSVEVYRTEEPRPGGGRVTRFDTYTIRYPDGPHNCECLIVDPRSGDLYLVTKGEKEAIVFRVARPRGTGNYAAERLGVFHPDTGMGKYGRLVTAGDADPDGRHVVLRTYTGALEFPVKGEFKDWWKGSPQRVGMPLDPQGEGICYSRDGRFLLTTTEGNPSAVHLIPPKN